MRSHVGRLYAAAITLLVFFVSWVLVATRPWAPSAKEDPRLAQLERREQRLKAEAVRVRKIVKRRWARYHRRLAKLNPELAPGKRPNGKGVSVAVLAATPSPSSSGGGRSSSQAGGGPSGGASKPSAGGGSSGSSAAAPPPAAEPPPEPAPPPVTESGSS